jgi:hypothetical protein
MLGALVAIQGIQGILGLCKSIPAIPAALGSITGAIIDIGGLMLPILAPLLVKAGLVAAAAAGGWFVGTMIYDYLLHPAINDAEKDDEARKEQESDYEYHKELLDEKSEPNKKLIQDYGQEFWDFRKQIIDKEFEDIRWGRGGVNGDGRKFSGEHIRNQLDRYIADHGLKPLPNTKEDPLEKKYGKEFAEYRRRLIKVEHENAKEGHGGPDRKGKAFNGVYVREKLEKYVADHGLEPLPHTKEKPLDGKGVKSANSKSVEDGPTPFSPRTGWWPDFLKPIWLKEGKDTTASNPVTDDTTNNFQLKSNDRMPDNVVPSSVDKRENNYEEYFKKMVAGIEAIATAATSKITSSSTSDHIDYDMSAIGEDSSNTSNTYGGKRSMVSQNSPTAVQGA